MSENMDLYNQFRTVPNDAQKEIGAGRLKGMTDINPMWRIQKLTEVFGPCGIGWWYKITKQWLEVSNTDEISAFCNISLYYMWNDKVSEAVEGTGGASFVANEKTGLHQSDECYKMALTDAISVAAKSLGVGADIYWGKISTKYSKAEPKKSYDEPSDAVTIAAFSKLLTETQTDGVKMVEWLNNKFKVKNQAIKDFTKIQLVEGMKALENKKAKMEANK